MNVDAQETNAMLVKPARRRDPRRATPVGSPGAASRAAFFRARWVDGPTAIRLYVHVARRLRVIAFDVGFRTAIEPATSSDRSRPA
jgi:hypothetical protein